jgi:multidrug efflux pump
MNVPAYFLNRPVMATIINVMILVVGLISYTNLNVREYPTVSSPVLTIKTVYSNASADVVEREVTNPMEELLASISGIEHTTSKSEFNQSSIELRFKNGVDLNQAKSDIREMISLARSVLPTDIKEPQIDQEASDNDAFFYMALYSENRTFAELGHMANLLLKNPLKTIEGVSRVDIHGDTYAMSVALNRAKMIQHGLDPTMVMAALDTQNVSLPAGRHQFAVPINFDLAANSAEQFEYIPINTPNNTVVYLKDIADISLSTAKTLITRINGKPGVIIAVRQNSDGNPLDISDAIHNQIGYYKSLLPSDVHLEIVLDKTKFIRGSLTSIYKSLLEAVILVIGIIYLFLRSARATIVPLVTIPLSLIGVMSLMSLFGLSINIITLLALVLAVGLVVDDAIVMLENIHRHMENGLSRMEAAKKGAGEIGFAIIAMTLTLASVYAPIAFIQDTIGQVFYEFALTLAGAVIISGVVALTFSPLMCSILLKPVEEKKESDIFIRISHIYRGLIQKTLRKTPLMLSLCGLSVLACALLYNYVPHTLTPKEDRGFIGMWVKPLAGTSLTEFDKYLRQAEAKMAPIAEVPQYITFAGDWGGQVVAGLEDWSSRKRKAQDIVASLQMAVQEIPTAEVYPWSWDSGIPGVEQVSENGQGFNFVLKTTESYEDLARIGDKLRDALSKSPLIKEVRHNLKLIYPNFDMQVDRKKMVLTGLAPSQMARNVKIMMDGDLTLEFKKDGITYPIDLHGYPNANFLEEIYAVNNNNKLVPISYAASLDRVPKPDLLRHHNQMRATTFTVEPAEGVSMQKAMDEINRLYAKTIGAGVTMEYTGEAKKIGGNHMIFLLIIALIFIYAILAIQFESFIDPLIIMFTVPLAGAGALFTLWATGETLNIFSQIGLVTLVGLITKHGILMVEFANQQLQEHKKKLEEAVITAAQLRLRPILMTTGAMVFGAVPLIISTGAGAEARMAIGLVLVAGLIFGTLLTLFIIPTVYVTIKKWHLHKVQA